MAAHTAVVYMACRLEGHARTVKKMEVVTPGTNKVSSQNLEVDREQALQRGALILRLVCGRAGACMTTATSSGRVPRRAVCVLRPGCGAADFSTLCVHAGASSARCCRLAFRADACAFVSAANLGQSGDQEKEPR